MNINEKYLAGSKNRGRRAELIREIAAIYERGKPYPKRLEALMKERDQLEAGGAAQQAAIAISMKARGQKPKSEMKSGGMADLDAAEKEVYKRGLAAYMSSGNRPKVSQHAWARARVNSPFGKREAAKIRKEGTGEKKEEKKGGGLWANIHAKRARGERMRKKGEAGAPTEEQMNRAKASTNQKHGGSYMRRLPGGAVEFIGPKHAQGGIMIDPQTEVEGGETMDKVMMQGGKRQDYIFSDFLKLGGKTFAQRHKEMLNGGATQKQIQDLAKLQEEVAQREGRDENGRRDPNMVMQRGGVKKLQTGDAYTPIVAGVDPDKRDYNFQGIGYEWDYDIPDEVLSAIDMSGRIGREGDTENILRSVWARQQGLPSDMTTEELEDYYNNTYVPAIKEYFEANKESVIENAKRMASRSDRNQSNWTKIIGKPDKDGNFKKSDSEIFEEAVKLTTDGNVGSWHSLLPQAPVETPDDPQFEISQTEQTTERQVPQGCPCEDGSLSPDCCEIPEKRDILLPYQLIGPVAELTTRYPQPEKIAAQPTGRIKLPRVNFNAERASLGNTTTAANKFIQNNAAGPAAISAIMATNEKQRSGNLDIANAEARNNKELAAREELANLQASQFDSGQAMRASMFNAQSQNQRDQNEYEKRMLAFNQFGTNLAQYANDRRAYKAEERIADAFQVDNEYSRQKAYEAAMSKRGNKRSAYYGKSPMEIREMIAQAFQYGAPTWNAQNAVRRGALVQNMNEDGTYPMATTSMPGPTRTIQGPTITTTQTNATTTPELLSALENYRGGGYIRKFGKIKRKRKK
jgi:hypothetical protein